MAQIGRNDPCPCGSGKKYKKCCGKTNVVSIDRVLEREIIENQVQILDYALSKYGVELQETITDIMMDMQIPENLTESFGFMLTNWMIFTEHIDSDNRIIDFYIKDTLQSIKRPKLKEIILSWSHGRPIIGKLVSKDNAYFILEDILSEQTFRVKVMEEPRLQTDLGSAIIGVIVPIGGNEFTFFTTFFDLSNMEAESFISEARSFYNSDGVVGNSEQFLSEHFPEFFEMALFGGPVKAEFMDWETYPQQRVAEIFQSRMEQLGNEQSFIELGLMLWKKYCEDQNPIIKKPSVFAAALHYLVDECFIGEMTQKALADLYGASVSSISQKYRSLEEVLEEEINNILKDLVDHFNEGIEHNGEVDFESRSVNAPFKRFETERTLLEMTRQMEGKNFDSIDEINAFLNSPNLQKRGPVSDREKAQDLIFDAYEASGKKRKALLEKALKLDPDHPDAYNIMAEEAKSADEACKLYREGVVRGEKRLGQAYFKENMGRFWGLVETRPFMRAKFNYGRTLQVMGKVKEAIAQYEELLELNEMDNQGVRYLLFGAYVKNGDLNQAERLLEKYPDNYTASGLYNQCLLEGMKNGKTPRFKKMLTKAMKQNPYVMDYLTGKKRLPAQIPEAYTVGDTSEAIVYVGLNGELWLDSGLL
ncbi:MAG: tetratricopeptide repeat protein [Tuberibacillus sp.]